MSAAVRRVCALDDGALVDAMRAGDELALGEFLARFRPLLQSYARTRIPEDLWAECIDEVLEDEAIRLCAPGATVPTRLRGYLIGAARNRYLTLRRGEVRRQRRYEAAAPRALCTSDGEAVVHSACAESTVAASRGPVIEEEAGPSAVELLARAMDAELDEETRQLLVWIGSAVPHREIARWLDRSYEATTKRIWRLCRRLERAAPQYAATLSPAVQGELERFFRRVERGRRPA